MSPAGEKAAWPAGPAVAVTRRGAPASDPAALGAATSQMSVTSSWSRSSWRADVKAIARPSGDHAGSAWSWSPSVIWRGGAAVGGHHEDLQAPVIGEALAVEPVLHGGDHARRLRLALVLLGLGLGRAAHSRREGEARAVGRPLGRAHAVPEIGEARSASPPAAGITWSWPFLPGSRSEMKARREPSGDQRGAGVPSRAGREAAGLAAGRARPSRCWRGTRPAPRRAS